jgi:ABC-type transporter MlaC component
LHSLHHAAVLIVGVLMALGSPVLAGAQGNAAIDEFVTLLSEQMRASGGGIAACRGLADRVLDLPAMARAAIGERWGAMTPSQRTAYGAAFDDRVLVKCAGIIGDYHGDKIVLMGVRPAGGGDLLATTRLGPSEADRMVTWRLRNGEKRVIDVIGRGGSAVASARNEYSAILQSNNGDIDALIAFLRRAGPCAGRDCGRD